MVPFAISSKILLSLRIMYGCQFIFWYCKYSISNLQSQILNRFMPLVYQQNINATTKIAVWHISETEDLFLAKVPLQREIRHWHKRLQHLAGRLLLKELFPDFPVELIQIADTKKPFLENEPYHFSI